MFNTNYFGKCAPEPLWFSYVPIFNLVYCGRTLATLIDICWFQTVKSTMEKRIIEEIPFCFLSVFAYYLMSLLCYFQLSVMRNLCVCICVWKFNKLVRKSIFLFYDFSFLSLLFSSSILCATKDTATLPCWQFDWRLRIFSWLLFVLSANCLWQVAAKEDTGLKSTFLGLFTFIVTCVFYTFINKSWTFSIIKHTLSKKEN